jgi:hypothetical protein
MKMHTEFWLGFLFEYRHSEDGEDSEKTVFEEFPSSGI